MLLNVYVYIYSYIHIHIHTCLCIYMTKCIMTMLAFAAGNSVGMSLTRFFSLSPLCLPFLIDLFFFSISSGISGTFSTSLVSVVIILEEVKIMLLALCFGNGLFEVLEDKAGNCVNPKTLCDQYT